MNPSKKQNNPSFLSLPDEIVLTCLARISRSYYPKLVLVCKTFRSLIVSKELNDARDHLQTQETVFQVSIQFPNNPCPSWYTLWIKPGQILINQLDEKTWSTTRNIRLIQISTSSCYSYEPLHIVSVGSEIYGISQSSAPSSTMWVQNKEIGLWRKAPNMTVAREKALVRVHNGKIYVMGGRATGEYTNWGEVFDPKTQTWEPLPDPGPEHRFSSIRKIQVFEGKFSVIGNEKTDSVYDPKESKWYVEEKLLVHCMVDNVWYTCDQDTCYWFDTNGNKWRVVRGLVTLNTKRRSGMVQVANYNGKLLILWDDFVPHDPYGYKDIWCAVIALERRKDDIWGNIEWASIVLTVPSSYVFLRGLSYAS